MDDSAAAALSVMVTRSRVTGQHRAYVRFGDFEAGFRDLDTGQVHSVEGYAAHVAGATEGMVRRRGPSRPVAPTTQLSTTQLPTTQLPTTQFPTGGLSAQSLAS
jgi:hypothetical protein